MDKRIHMKRSVELKCRHYLLHFKWPLFCCLFLLIFISFNSMSFPSLSSSPDELLIPLKISYKNVIYPIDVFHKDNGNISIINYFQRKNELKAIDDKKAIQNKQKSIIPLEKGKLAVNSYLILEFTHVFQHPRFCSHKKHEIFGQTCPYTNWYVKNPSFFNKNHVRLFVLVNTHVILNVKTNRMYF